MKKSTYHFLNSKQILNNKIPFPMYLPPKWWLIWFLWFLFIFLIIYFYIFIFSIILQNQTLVFFPYIFNILSILFLLHSFRISQKFSQFSQTIFAIPFERFHNFIYIYIYIYFHIGAIYHTLFVVGIWICTFYPPYTFNGMQWNAHFSSGGIGIVYKSHINQHFLSPFYGTLKHVED